MTWPAVLSRPLFASLLCLILSISISHSQCLEGNLKDANIRADYLIITPPSFLSTIQPLAAFRASHNAFSVAVVLTDSVYSQFPSSAPDSALRAFLTYAHSSWGKPAPAYVLLAGNTTLVPTHMEASGFSDFGEDSAAIDQWYVDTLFLDGQFPFPTTALGRLPAWNSEELSAMVAKTIQYETAQSFSHADRFIAVADLYNLMDFEPWAIAQQTIIAPVWTDTVTVSLRPSSPRFKTRSQFIDLWNQGAAAIDFVGPANNVQYAGSAYFTSADIDSLNEGSSLTFCFFMGGQRFQERDTVALAVNLLRADDRGGVGVLAPSGISYATENASLMTAICNSLVAEPGLPIGIAIMRARQQESSSIERRETLLGDPALVLRHKTIASVPPPLTGPREFQLFQNYPNPFNPSTTIRYALPHRSYVTLTVFNTLGQQMATMVNGEVEAGYHEVQFNASHLASRVYVYRLSTGNSILAKQMVLVK